MYGKDGLDEISNVGITKIVEFTADKLWEYEISPEDLGLHRASPEEISVHNKDESVLNFLRVLYGKEEGPRQDIVSANAGASLYVMGKATTLKAGVELAQSIIYSGHAAKMLEKLIEYSAGSDGQNRLSDLKSRAKI